MTATAAGKEREPTDKDWKDAINNAEALTNASIAATLDTIKSSQHALDQANVKALNSFSKNLGMFGKVAAISTAIHLNLLHPVATWPAFAMENRPQIVGCWGHATSIQRPASALWLCFRESGRLEGWSADSGHGADFAGRWKFPDTDKVLLEIGNAKIVCSVHRKQPDSLVLEACSEPTMNSILNRIADPNASGK
ncbi:hypothetical protein [Microvirga thermotolerans]|uniref:Uncharacterized protein n=1 Tax=Microvirga thermotolerans TaxID=2651334 RepID=A0A5P9K0L6_9HYPH|nr:hypothetical protein [Microvirga thermotolerans]QFU17200.1 hypothetical protein GDR74_13760 [Microvirga thermotolerans]